jgi:intracellular multiplication protein IcmD
MKEEKMRRSKQNKLSLRMSAAFTAGILMTSSSAHADGSGGGQDIVANIVDSVSTIPALMATLCYIAGIALAILGILKIKAHVDNPQTPLKDGMMRLAAGGAFLALPVVLRAMSATIGDGGGFSDVPELGPVTLP